MNKDVLVLKDASTIELEAGASLNALRVESADKAAMVATWDRLNDGNLEEVQVKNGDGLVVGNYTGLVLVSETSTVAENGSVLTTYALREKTDEERRLDALEAGQEVRDGAITELAEMAAGGEA